MTAITIVRRGRFFGKRAQHQGSVLAGFMRFKALLKTFDDAIESENLAIEFINGAFLTGNQTL
jgi:hypothetical protein